MNNYQENDNKPNKIILKWAKGIGINSNAMWFYWNQ